MTNNIITAVGIDVSKEKSMIAIRHPGGEILRIHRTEQPKQQNLNNHCNTLAFSGSTGSNRGGGAERGSELSQPFRSCKRAEFP